MTTPIKSTSQSKWYQSMSDQCQAKLQKKHSGFNWLITIYYRTRTNVSCFVFVCVLEAIERRPTCFSSPRQVLTKNQVRIEWKQLTTEKSLDVYKLFNGNWLWLALIAMFVQITKTVNIIITICMGGTLVCPQDTFPMASPCRVSCCWCFILAIPNRTKF